MDRNFARSLKHVLKHEGGYANNPKDPGGPTNKGITLATFRSYVKASGSVADLKAITDAQVATVYRKQYWNAVNGDALPDGVDYAVFDFAVNSGPSRAAKYLQAVVGASQDGKVGPGTLAAVRSKAQTLVINRLCDDRLAFMKRIKDSKGRSLWATFGRGWNSRVAAVRAEAMSMAGQRPTATKDRQDTSAKQHWLAAFFAALFSIFKRG
ncbi:glycoside hydrolase family 108 protein [Allomesorhizobium alhagi]|uniref:Uncharacterized protein n=1 Tax=Mesorhizobium alhagi CCNWXJ12-2 TaxID=1107882 RepID=H0HR26_9HYPH|nr:glycoside hydrolase family 108 protein [Mesorhizobium alhagi]EHK56806.1 hypothetical protein MAXJ12_13046 [Mesorhizobium alhagi CCNWXJ12-2]